MAYAFAVPIPAEKTEAVRRLTDECLGPRKAEYDDLQRRSGITSESYWLQRDPERGNTLIVVSSDDPTAFTEIMASPKTAFDRWYREQIMEIFGADPGEPWGERNELIGTWKA
jgi:hypothetical protein